MPLPLPQIDLDKQATYLCWIITKRSELKLKESPNTESYARWCERTDREIIPIFLLDYVNETFAKLIWQKSSTPEEHFQPE